MSGQLSDKHDYDIVPIFFNYDKKLIIFFTFLLSRLSVIIDYHII